MITSIKFLTEESYIRDSEYLKVILFLMEKGLSLDLYSNKESFNMECKILNGNLIIIPLKECAIKGKIDIIDTVKLDNERLKDLFLTSRFNSTTSLALKSDVEIFTFLAYLKEVGVLLYRDKKKDNTLATYSSFPMKLNVNTNNIVATAIQMLLSIGLKALNVTNPWHLSTLETKYYDYLKSKKKPIRLIKPLLNNKFTIVHTWDEEFTVVIPKEIETKLY